MHPNNSRQMFSRLRCSGAGPLAMERGIFQSVSLNAAEV